VLQCVAVWCSVLKCVAVCCSVLQCVAVCCSVLQCVEHIVSCISTLQHTAQHTATHCNTLQRTATHCKHMVSCIDFCLVHSVGYCIAFGALFHVLYCVSAYDTCVENLKNVGGRGRDQKKIVQLLEGDKNKNAHGCRT